MQINIIVRYERESVPTTNFTFPNFPTNLPLGELRSEPSVIMIYALLDYIFTFGTSTFILQEKPLRLV